MLVLYENIFLLLHDDLSLGKEGGKTRFQERKLKTSAEIEGVAGPATWHVLIYTVH